MPSLARGGSIAILMDLVLDPSALQDLFTKHPDGPTAKALAKGREAKARIWIYVGDLPLLSQKGDFSQDLSLVGNFQWLAALATDGAAWVEDPSGRVARLQAVKRLGGDARLLTLEASAGEPVALGVSEYLDIPAKEPKVDFIDLQTQLDRLRPGIEKEVFQVIHHGRYILGPEIAAVEERLAEFTGVSHCISVASGT
ncbi:MAG: DegT/DnrJ/EryC1/StrS family aminotransferase, partial [Verrucomicrobiota bacterium]